MKRFIILGGVVLLGAVSALMYTLFPPVETQLNADMAEDGEVSVTETERNAVQSGSVRFSLPSGFYSENISLELSADSGTVYFTTDGSDPVPGESEFYTQPIEINATPEVRATTVKALSVLADGTKGDICTVTLSPGRILIKFIRSLPEMCARMVCPPPISTENMAFGSASVTMPSSSITSSFAKIN